MKRSLLFLLLFCCTVGATAQRVGVVLSGGGAKGLYHVGILKALEENDIPVDYISGASMGAIVAGMYAAGYSPDEMIRFFGTDSVQSWISMKSTDLDNHYYFKKFEPTPAMITLRIDPSGQRSEYALQLPTNFVSSYKLDLAFIRMLSPASAASGDDFNRLMVPFRCNASDVAGKKSVVFDQGSLPFAIRASMTVPLVFRPLNQDSTLLFDGGLYNNFPWQPLCDDFQPDILIGGVCAGNLENPSPDNVVQQVTTMITGLTDYTLPDSLDVLIQRRFSEIGTMDYDRADYLIAYGYEDAMRQMPILKARIARRTSEMEVQAKRAAFRAEIKPLIFDRLDIEGLTPQQTEYAYRQLGLKPQQVFDMAYFEKKYMQMLAGGIFTGEFPQVSYSSETGLFCLKLTLRTQASMSFALGGNISSTALSQGYAAFSYRTVRRNVSTYALRGFFGTFYRSVQVGGRHDIYTQFPFFIDYHYTYENYDYNASHMSRYYEGVDWRYLKRKHNEAATSIAVPVLENAVFRGKLGLGVLDDYYFPEAFTNLDRPDRSMLTYAALSAEVQQRSLDYTLFPTRGANHLLFFRFTEGLERYQPGTLPGGAPFDLQNRNWWEARYQREVYRPLGRWFTLGYLFDVAISNCPDFSNPLVQAMHEPTFQPLPIMRAMFMPEYRSPSFVGAGVVPLFRLFNNVSLRTYAYAFVPQEVAYDHGWQSDFWERLSTRTEFVLGGSLVYQTLIGPASLTVNKYSTGPSGWQVAFNFGYVLFSSRKY